MGYRDITAYASNRFQLPASHPFLAEVVIDPLNWRLAQWVAADDPALCIVGHDRPRAGQMVVHVACTSDEVRRSVMDDWS
jgi:hypothetical protein